ncbi:ArsO family NAD(P)H-dependent flavin-containing monooxygenase [Aquipuribacter sp. MA13-6]|uniref:ArsO family NAD(P)H-dependent flavin-containing monooxygenase n=1 Tax=unclassified Aquipuribacter TaxID=2635084 RepID=UPI003EEA900A
MSDQGHVHDLVVVGGGQSGLAVSWYARRAGLDHVVLDASDGPGGAWPHTWDALQLFSPADHSSLPGWPMPVPAGGREAYPGRDHVVDYLRAYEQRYDLPVRRPVRVNGLTRATDGTWRLVTGSGEERARHVVSATGTWTAPFVPHVPGAARFPGRQLHAVGFHRAGDHAGERVLVVGGGNSGAQIAAELVHVAGTTWATREPARFLPDDVDGRVLFATATARAQALAAGHPDTGGVASLGDVVATAAVRRARDEKGLAAVPGFTGLDGAWATWADGSRREVDTIIWATGFRAALRHVSGLRLGHPPQTDGTRCLGEEGLWFVGYGDWTGPASATLIGVGRTARATVEAVVAALGGG